MKVNEKYKTRHSILSVLFKKLKYNDLHFFNLTDSSTSVEELAQILNTTVDNILTAHHGLTKHIDCVCKNGKHLISINADGIDAYIDNYWLREGQKDLNERIYDRTKWTVPLIALVVTVISILFAIYNSNAVLNKVEKVQKEINLLKSKN